MSKKWFTARMRVTRTEHWDVEAETVEEARAKFAALDEDVIVDDQGETVDWEVEHVKASDA